MARGYLDGNVFHDTRGCEDCVDPEYELSISMALKWDADLCDECVGSV